MKIIYNTVALFCILISIMLWIPNLFFDQGNPTVMFTFLIGGVGFFISLKTKKNYLLIGNLLACFSFYLFMFVGYIVEAIK